MILWLIVLIKTTCSTWFIKLIFLSEVWSLHLLIYELNDDSVVSIHSIFTQSSNESLLSNSRITVVRLCIQCWCWDNAIDFYLITVVDCVTAGAPLTELLLHVSTMLQQSSVSWECFWSSGAVVSQRNFTWLSHIWDKVNCRCVGPSLIYSVKISNFIQMSEALCRGGHGSMALVKVI